uniref:Ig-like domain-containing protein n=1 Tax=Strongyloides venezuelensis TaxID=75913 RepID=A0A0K0EZC8_STRVS
MLSILYLLVAAMALVPLSIHANDPNHWKLFPPTFKDIKDGTFPIAKTTNGSSDMILVKCPRIGYKHFKKGDSFETDESMNNSTSYIPNNQIPLSRIPLMKGLSGSASINCGIVNLQQDENTRKNYKWSYNVKWGNATNAETITKKYLIINMISTDQEKCPQTGTNILILTNMKKGGIVKVDPYDIKNLYVHQKFYFFVKPDPNNKNIIQEPCTIIKAYRLPPKIIILDHEKLSDELEPSQIKTINTTGTEKTIKNFNVQLYLKNDINFYRGERISLTKMRYIEGGPILIKNSGIIVTSNITIKGYELTKMEYIYEGKTKKQVISKMYYFGPSSADLKIDNVAVPYVKGEVTGQPNCSIFFMTVGYLQEIGYNGKKYARNTTQTKEKFEESGDLYYLKSNHESSVSLECIYRTPGGKITTRTNFVVNGSEKETETFSNLKITIYNAYNISLVLSLFVIILKY